MAGRSAMSLSVNMRHQKANLNYLMKTIQLTKCSFQSCPWGCIFVSVVNCLGGNRTPLSPSKHVTRKAVYIILHVINTDTGDKKTADLRKHSISQVISLSPFSWTRLSFFSHLPPFSWVSLLALKKERSLCFKVSTVKTLNITASPFQI